MNKILTVINIRHKHRQRGIGLATAIYIITAMALLVVLLNQLVQTNAGNTSEELALTRAFYAAESGIQIGLNAVFPPAESGLLQSCPATTSYPAFQDSGLNACVAIVECSELQVDVDGNGSDESIFTLVSTGSCAGVSRTIQVRAR